MSNDLSLLYTRNVRFLIKIINNVVFRLQIKYAKYYSKKQYEVLRIKINKNNILYKKEIIYGINSNISL